MPPLSLSRFKVNHKLTITKWPSFLNKVNSLFLNNIFHAPIMVSHPIKLNPQTSMVKLKNGLKLISELELQATFQSKTKLFLLMERNTLIKHLLLLQDLITVIIMLKDFQK